MKKPREFSFLARVSHAFETALVYVVYGFFSLLPVDAASAAGGALMRAIGPHLGMSRVARRNLDLAFPEKTGDEKKLIIRGMWDNLGRVAAEYPHLGKLGARTEFVGDVPADVLRGKPALIFAAHVGNWEVCPVKGRDIRLPVQVVYRKPNNPWVDGLLRRARGAGAEGMIKKGAGSAREILSALKKNGTVGLLVDQKMNEGIAVPFFGRDAMTAPALAFFALRRSCPVYPMRIERLGGVKFRLTLYPEITITRTGDEEADIRRAMTEVSAIIESWVRERPEQWLWIHRRWPESKEY